MLLYNTVVYSYLGLVNIHILLQSNWNCTDVIEAGNGILYLMGRIAIFPHDWWWYSGRTRSPWAGRPGGNPRSGTGWRGRGGGLGMYAVDMACT